ncbi:AP2 associated kinase 1 [Rhodotorula toruloides]|nr:AP2 associated kinase 1 [Rhodotorula toruloides]
MAELWLKGDYPIGPFPHPPIEQAVADVLAKAPWSGYSTGDVGFRHDFVDRPEAGTAFLALLQPPPRPAPPDGLRYLYDGPTERRTVSQHTVTCPTNVNTPTQNTAMQVELECFTAFCGHLPPRDQPYPPNSPELRLTRFRKRWRITNGQYPTLWFCYWGQDQSGGSGQGSAPNAPAGWDSMPARQYPLQRPPNVPNNPIYPFPSPNRPPPSAQPVMPGTPQNARPPQNYGTPQAPFTTTPASGLARQQQLAALQNQAALGLSTSNPTLEARQQQFQAQQQAMAAQQALAAQQARAGYPDPPLAQGNPAGMTPQQQLQAQQAFLLAQQQRQQQQQAVTSTPADAQAQAARAAVHAQAIAARTQRKASGSAPSAVQPPAAASSSRDQDDTAPPTDILDHLTPRQLAIHRYAHNHDILAPIFDPWPTSSILSGEPRQREVEEILATTGVSSRSGEPRVGAVPGLGRDGGLAVLATSAARISAFAALGKEPEKARLPLEERRNQLLKMLENIEGSIERMEQRHQEKVAQIRAGPKA